MSTPIVYSVISAVSYSCRAWLFARVFVQAQSKDGGWSSSGTVYLTKIISVQPPPLAAINGVAGSGFQ